MANLSLPSASATALRAALPDFPGTIAARFFSMPTLR